jgi:hypothetical protein
VVNALVNGSNITGSSIRTKVGGNTLGSFDATGTNYIITKKDGVRFARPNGSTDGVTALSRSIDGNPFSAGTVLAGQPTATVITGAVDIARSSSTPTAGTGAGKVNTAGELLYVPFGRDAIAYAVSANSTATGIGALTASQLKSIFECTNQVVGGVTVTPVLPQSGSGTRKDFLNKIGMNKDLADSGLGSCVRLGQEHDANSLTAPNYIMPMSVSRWVAMNTGASISKINGASVSGVASVQGTPVSPVTGSGTSMAPVQAYYDDDLWGRDTFLVVEYARVDSTEGNLAYEPDLAAALNPAISNSLANIEVDSNNRAGKLKLKYGFLAPETTTPFRVFKS